jgi:hypothetical protein
MNYWVFEIGYNNYNDITEYTSIGLGKKIFYQIM